MHDRSAKIRTPPQTRAVRDVMHAAGFSGRDVVVARNAADLVLVARRGRLAVFRPCFASRPQPFSPQDGGTRTRA